jgi:hypothetical protein
VLHSPADREASNEAQQGKRQQTVRERGEAGEHCVEEHGKHHHALAADIIGENSAEEAAKSPAKQSDADRRSSVKCRRLHLHLRGGENRFQGERQRDDQCVGFIAVEDPTEVAAPEDAPVFCRQFCIPG